MVDLFTADFNSLSNEARYLAITDFADALPFESNRHDFKEIWGPKVVEDVAAFANTFGGILIVGVRKGSKDLQARLVGVESRSELSTGIASAIATNISPTPFYEIMECYDPNEPTRRFCVVRVHNSFSVHLVTRKGVGNPAFIRNCGRKHSCRRRKAPHDHYPRIAYSAVGEAPLAQVGTDRSSDVFDYRWFQPTLAYESRWRATENLDIVHAVQVNLNGKWSLPDLVVYSMLLLVIGGKWWESVGFFGEGVLVADLSVKKLQLKQEGATSRMGLIPGWASKS